MANLTKAEKLVQSKCWRCSNGRPIDRSSGIPLAGTLQETQRAAELLAKRGVIEIASHSNQYRIKPKS
jgi:hypothetical protein